jgi:hypothetical protein
MRRALQTETIMTNSTAHPHAAMDKFPAFLASIRSEFPDDYDAIADEIIDKELGDFCWESRVAERQICVLEPLDDDEIEREEVRILGYFRGRYLVATCIIDADHRLEWMPKVRHFDAQSEAEMAFLASN